jgi:hypothetical protein
MRVRKHHTTNSQTLTGVACCKLGMCLNCVMHLHQLDRRKATLFAREHLTQG